MKETAEVPGDLAKECGHGVRLVAACCGAWEIDAFDVFRSKHAVVAPQPILRLLRAWSESSRTTNARPYESAILVTATVAFWVPKS
jgi:hypothetical protein